MRINFRHGAAMGILVTSFGLVGPVSAQAAQISGSSVPAASHLMNQVALPGDRCDRWDWWRYGDCRYEHYYHHRHHCEHYWDCRYDHGYGSYAESANRMSLTAQR